MEANDQTAVNAKRFRKVAKMIRRLIDHIRKEKYLPEKLARDTFDQVDDLAKEALIAPPRNCDVGTAEEQLDRYGEYCQKKCLDCEHRVLCRIRGESYRMLCIFRWAQMPYKEGGL